VTLRAQGRLGAEGLTCKVETGRALVEAGLHSATGGDGHSACSGDMLLEALVACAGVTLRPVATVLEVDVRGGTVSAEVTLIFAARLASAERRRSAFATLQRTRSRRSSRTAIRGTTRTQRTRIERRSRSG
jgi:uncharacterized OsmC-like protein